MAAKANYPLFSSDDNFNPDDIRKNYLEDKSVVADPDPKMTILWYSGKLCPPKGLLVCTENNFTDYDFLTERMGEKEKKVLTNEDGISLSMLWDTPEYHESKKTELYSSHKDFRSQIAKYQVNASLPISPPVMRLSWIRDIFLEYKLEKPKIIDPFMGTGETLLAACLLGCDFIGFAKNINEDYAEVIETFGDYNKQVIHKNKKDYPVITERLVADVVLTHIPNFRDYNETTKLSYTSYVSDIVLRGLIQAWNALKYDGYLIYTTRDYLAKESRFITEPLQLFIEQILVGSSWTDDIALYDEHNETGLVAHIWKKVNKDRKVIDTKKKTIAEEISSRQFAKEYPDIKDKLIVSWMFGKIYSETKDLDSLIGVMNKRNFDDAFNSVMFALDDFSNKFRSEEKELFKSIFSDPWTIFPIVTITDYEVTSKWIREIYSVFKESGGSV